jgi:hypothetical protein
MPASRSVVSVLLRELGEFSLHPQGRPAGGRLRRPSSAGRPHATIPGMTRTTSSGASRHRRMRWPYLIIGLGGLLYAAGVVLVDRRVPVGLAGGGVVLVLLGLGLLGPPTSFTWSRRTAVISLIAFAILGAGLIVAGGASLAGLLGPTEPGGFRTNDFAAVAICLGAVALVFAYASYRSILRMR